MFIEDPYSYYSRLRKSGRIHFEASLGTIGAWLVPHYEDVANIYKNPNLSSARSYLLFNQFASPIRMELEQSARLYRYWAVFSDPPVHTFWRKVLVSAFNPVRMLQFRPQVEKIVQDSIATAAQKRQIDFVSDFATLLPLRVVSLLLGIGEEDYSRLLSWSLDLNRFFLATPGASAEIGIQAQSTFIELHQYFKSSIEARLSSPKEDGISCMIEAIEAASLESAKKQHTLLEILPSQCCALMYAGHQTTSDLLSNGMYAFLRNPNQFQLLAKNPQLASRAAAEIARYDSPVHTDGRVVTRSCDFLGHTFEPGHMITLLVASANHDEEKFTQPDIFDISRQTPYRSLTFGNGAHRCIGEQFALFEISTVFQRLSSKFPKMKLIRQDVEYKLSLKQRGVKSLPVCFF